MIGIGEKFPAFSLAGINDKNEFVRVDVEENYTPMKHDWSVVYFYPKDFTPGCTKEACGFRDNYEVFNNLNCSVFGVSSDSEKRHLSFAKKFNLNFDLIADRDKELSNLFQVQRNLFGLIPGRVTYIFDENGICQGVFDSLRDADGHIEHALNTLKSLD